MKKIILILCALAPLLPIRSADVTFNLADFTTGAITNRPLRIEPKSTPRASGTNIISRDTITRYSDTNGILTVTNMVRGTYLCTLLGPFARSEFRIFVTDTNTALDASDLIISANDAGIDTEDGLTLDLE
jgi:hypothetical protein